MSIEKVKERIRCLLNTAKNDASTEGEINNALRFARNLMNKHHLSEDDLVDGEIQTDFKKDILNAERSRCYVSIGGKLYKWEGLLASFVRDFVGGVGCYIDNSKTAARDPRGMAMKDIWGEYYQGKRVCFYGLAEDAHLASEVFHELRLTICATARLKFGACYTGDGGSYSEGFVNGLFTKIEYQAKLEYQEATGGGLIVIQKRDEIIKLKQSIAEEIVKGVKIQPAPDYSGASGSYEARMEGFKDGKESEVERKRRLKIEDHAHES